MTNIEFMSEVINEANKIMKYHRKLVYGKSEINQLFQHAIESVLKRQSAIKESETNNSKEDSSRTLQG